MTALRVLALTTALALTTVPALAQMEPSAGEKLSRGRSRPDTKPSVGEAPPVKQDKQFPFGTQWAAVSLKGKAFGGERPSFSLDQQLRARGFGGCNTYAAVAYPLREQGIAVGPLAVTKRACDKAAMASEHAFMVALRTVAKWDSNGSSLVLTGPNGELRFERVL